MRIALPLLCLPLLITGLAQAQESAPQVSVRLTSVKGVGKLKKGDKPAIPPTLKGVEPVLRKCAYDRYEYLQAPTKRGLAKTDFAFDKLPADHSAILRWEPFDKKGSDVLLAVTINKTTGDTQKKVASMKVRLKDGASYLIKVPGTYADGDLLLVVTVSRKAFAKSE